MSIGCTTSRNSDRNADFGAYPRERLIVDAVNMSRYASVNDGICYLYNLIDSFTKFAWSYPAKDKSASAFNQILNKHFLSEGKFDIFHSDNGSEFRNEQVEATLEKWGISERHGRAYHPQSQGQIERFNRTLKTKLRRTSRENKYISILDEVVYQYNCTKHSATKHKPMINYRGYDPAVFNSTYNNNSEYILQARINLMDYIERYRAEAQLIQNENFVQGDLVKVLKEYKV